MGKEDIIPNMEVKVGEKIDGEGGYKSLTWRLK